jgi:plastocyanin
LLTLDDSSLLTRRAFNRILHNHILPAMIPRLLLLASIGGLVGLASASPAPTPAPVPATSTSSSDDESSSSEPSKTSKSAAATWTITVGKAEHKFQPDTVQAEVGDLIVYDFFPPNHSVVRAEYGYPCVPYELTGKGKVGFFSDFHPVDAILDDPPSFSIRVNDSNPIFFYCSAPGSCIDWQM